MLWFTDLRVKTDYDNLTITVSKVGTRLLKIRKFFLMSWHTMILITKLKLKLKLKLFIKTEIETEIMFKTESELKLELFPRN